MLLVILAHLLGLLFLKHMNIDIYHLLDIIKIIFFLIKLTKALTIFYYSIQLNKTKYNKFGNKQIKN